MFHLTGSPKVLKETYLILQYRSDVWARSVNVLGMERHTAVLSLIWDLEVAAMCHRKQ